MDCFYLLDDQDRISDAGGEWIAYTDEGCDQIARPENIIGRNLFSYVSGTKTTALLRSLFGRSRREGSIVRSEYRCDSPVISRLFRMTIVPQYDGSLEIGHCLLETGTNTAPNEINVTIAAEACCSICCRYLVDGTWIETQMQPFTVFVSQNYTVCRRCEQRERMQAKAEHLQSGN